MAYSDVYNELLDLTQSTVAALGLEYTRPGDSTPTVMAVDKRTLARAEENLDTLPLIAIVPHPRAGERVTSSSFKNEVFVEYPCFVVLLAASNRDFVTMLPTWIGWRSQIRIALQPQINRVASAYSWRTVLNMDVPLPNDRQNRNYVYSAMGITYTAVEQRVPDPATFRP